MEAIVRPEGPGIVEEVHGKGHVMLRYEPGNGTSYVILMTRLENMAGKIAGCSSGGWVIQWLNAFPRPCKPFILSDMMGYLSLGYFAEKTGMEGADLIALHNLIGYKFPSTRR